MRLPFGFAKRNGVLISSDTETVLFKDGLSSTVYAEVQRFVGKHLEFRLVDGSTFDKQLSLSYQSDSDEAMQMIEDLGEDLDLGTIMDALPETGDLLEHNDDAPIIKLINRV